MFLVYILVALLVLAIMIFIHELGHFTAGRLLDFKILDFSLGFGPAIFQFKKNGINYALRAVPLGGACRFYGEDDEPMDAIAFNAQKVWKRIIVVFAGPLMNILFAFILGVIMFNAYGIEEPIEYENGDYAVVVTDFTSESSRAKLCGVEQGDIIIGIDGTDISSVNMEFDQRTAYCSELIADAEPEGITLSVLRDGAKADVYISDIYDQQEGRNILGIYMGPEYEHQSVPFFSSFAETGKYMVRVLTVTFQTIGGWFTKGVEPGEVSGPVGTVALTAQVAAMGFRYILAITVLISLSLGVFNLLPLPALDGGRLVFMFIELIFGKPVPREIEAKVHVIGLFMLLGIMALVTIFDVVGLFNGTLILNK